MEEEVGEGEEGDEEEERGAEEEGEEEEGEAAFKASILSNSSCIFLASLAWCSS